MSNGEGIGLPFPVIDIVRLARLRLQANRPLTFSQESLRLTHCSEYEQKRSLLGIQTRLIYYVAWH